MNTNADASAVNLVSQLEKLFNKLATSLNAPAITSIVRSLRSYNKGQLLTLAEAQEIEAAGADHKKAAMLLRIIIDRGNVAAEVFVSILRNEYVSRLDLADLIEGGEQFSKEQRIGETLLDSKDSTVPVEGELQSQQAEQKDTANLAQKVTTITVNRSLRYFHKTIPGIIKDIDKTIGISSYYLRSEYELVVHPQEEKDVEKLKKRFDVVKKDSPAKFYFVVEEKPAFATFAYDVECQSFGMYVQVDNAAYWVATAHGSIGKEIRKSFDGHSESCKIHTGQSKPVRFFLPGNGEKICVRMPTPYACFRIPNTYSYMEDIMVGPLTVSPKKLKADGGSFFGRNDLGNATFHETKLVCTSTERSSDESLHECEELLFYGMKVVSYSTYFSEPLVGRLYTTGGAKFSKENGTDNDNYIPFFTIEYECGVTPRKGHSGSVWAIQSDDGSYKAVAMTNAIDAKKWYATPLCCSFKSVKKTYSAVFPESSQFNGIGFFLQQTKL